MNPRMVGGFFGSLRGALSFMVFRRFSGRRWLQGDFGDNILYKFFEADPMVMVPSLDFGVRMLKNQNFYVSVIIFGTMLIFRVSRLRNSFWDALHQIQHKKLVW